MTKDTSEDRTRLLVVEDNEDTRFLIQYLLEDSYDVSLAGNAREALQQARSQQYDLILMDINLGSGASGTDVLRELRAMPAYHEVPIAALTAYALPGDREAFLESGFNAYLSKPFTADELQQMISQLLAKK